MPLSGSQQMATRMASPSQALCRSWTSWSSQQQPGVSFARARTWIAWFPSGTFQTAHSSGTFARQLEGTPWRPRPWPESSSHRVRERAHVNRRAGVHDVLVVASVLCIDNALDRPATHATPHALLGPWDERRRIPRALCNRKGAHRSRPCPTSLSVTPLSNRRALCISPHTMPTGLWDVPPRIDLPTTLSQWIGRWTQGMTARVLFDSDLDPRFAPDVVMSVLKDRTCHAFVWITEDGDVYGILAPDIETYWRARKEPLFTGFVFQTRTSAARMVPIRWFPSGESTGRSRSSSTTTSRATRCPGTRSTSACAKRARACPTRLRLSLSLSLSSRTSPCPGHCLQRPLA